MRSKANMAQPGQREMSTQTRSFNKYSQTVSPNQSEKNIQTIQPKYDRCMPLIDHQQLTLLLSQVL